MMQGTRITTMAANSGRVVRDYIEELAEFWMPDYSGRPSFCGETRQGGAILRYNDLRHVVVVDPIGRRAA